MEEFELDSLLKRLGYDVTLIGATYFSDVTYDICQVLDSMDIDMAYKFIPACCLEYGHFYYEIGLNKFNKDLDFFVASKNLTSENEELNMQVFGTTDSLEKEDSIMKVAKYINAQKKNVVGKSLIKSNNF